MHKKLLRERLLLRTLDAELDVARTLRLIRGTAGPDRDGRRGAAIRRLTRTLDQLRDFSNVIRATVSQKPRKRTK